jgi:hypothetical protein
MRQAVILVALALPVLTVADRPVARPLSAPAVAARYSPEHLQRLRQSLAAQIAVRDDAEGLRGPTAQEAAGLALPEPAAAAAVVPLPGGGFALRTDASQMALAVAERADDGTVRVSESANHASVVKGGAYVR